MWYHTFTFSHCSIKKCRIFHLFLLAALKFGPNEKFSRTHRKSSKLHSTSSNSKTQWLLVQWMNCFICHIGHWFLVWCGHWKHWVFSSLCHQIWGRCFYFFHLLDWKLPKIFSLCNRYWLKTVWYKGKSTHRTQWQEMSPLLDAYDFGIIIVILLRFHFHKRKMGLCMPIF